MPPPDESSVCPQPVRQWLAAAVAEGASDVHAVVGYRPILRVHGRLQQLDGDPLDDESMRRLLAPLCPANMFQRFASDKNVDFAFEVAIRGETRRFRANFFMNRGCQGACFRVIPSQIPDFQWAGFPRALATQLAHSRNGLVLFSGVSGSGKTTSLAMIVNLLNEEGGYRIITLEEPVEYLLPINDESVVTQREVGVDVHSFADGLKYGLRQDPDVILVGEIRDRETAHMALSAAETGHLVFSTLHTRDAKGAVSRFVDLFPQGVQAEIRAQLAMSLRAVVSQHLLPSIETGTKRELALEVMFNNLPVASAIRFGKLESIDNNIVIGRGEGMVPLDESVNSLRQAGRISREVAERFISDISLLRR